ncbi:MAG: hypothetical protein BRC34_02050 [Cyanobacteria bacterium QH_1_48_107]|nr:MAG: hypothetical protein BRC34_02050 [Cyanobacteria bacterium QH_1_48_107]PSO59044.1 MAG: hypothetical protein BRC36_16450 [Cyanobacteria bacterium QH_2_48_84]
MPTPPSPLLPLHLLDFDGALSTSQTAPRRTLIAGIGDALAKWYEASVSSGDSPATLTQKSWVSSPFL